MFSTREIRQQCPKCKGTGIDEKRPKLIDGKQSVVQFDKKTEVSVYENCDKCLGQGMLLQPVGPDRLVEGEKQPAPLLNNKPAVFA